ncbi:thiamine pyrophosphate-dependent enzyme [Amycolatopsis sp. NPDC059090]|uniref:thiamine pyrophosphate-dependent enzyme n=1 Tax=unclassified Amycolatopsis TaxID=2618356 RepID=UPI00366D6AB5
MRALTGGEAVVEALAAEGFDTLFGLPGVQNDWLYNALFDAQDRIRVVHTRHEQGAMYLGLGYALATGRPGLVNVVPGPGVLNAGAGLATAYALGAPVLLLAGQIPSASIGRGAGVLHELPDQLGMLRSLTKWAARIDSPAGAPGQVALALQQLRSGRPRPVALEVPMDVLERRAQVTLPPPRLPELTLPVDTDRIEEAAKLLGAATSPMIIVGGGAHGVAPGVRRLAELIEAPVVSYRSGRGIADSRDYHSLAQPAARPLWPDADVVLLLGTNARVPLQKWPADAERKIVRVDVDAAAMATIRRPDVGITARLEDALPLLTDRVEAHNRARPSRADELLAARKAWEQRSAVLEPQLSYLAVIRDALGEDGVFVDELTQVGFASRITFPVYHPRTFITTGYMGTLGYGFPTALGVKAARPDVPVISVTGDGGFLFGSSELATAVQHGIGLVTVVFNNNQYGNVQQMQRRVYGNRVIATDLVNPDFVALSEAFGAEAFRVSSPGELAVVLPKAVESGQPCVVEVQVGDMPSVDQFR